MFRIFFLRTLPSWSAGGLSHALLRDCVDAFNNNLLRRGNQVSNYCFGSIKRHLSAPAAATQYRWCGGREDHLMQVRQGTSGTKAHRKTPLMPLLKTLFCICRFHARIYSCRSSYRRLCQEIASLCGDLPLAPEHINFHYVLILYSHGREEDKINKINKIHTKLTNNNTEIII